MRTFWISLFDRDGPEYGEFVGLANYATIFTDRLMREAFRNNIFLWILFGVPLTVGFGLIIADAGGSQQVRAHCQGADLLAHGDFVCRRRRDLELHLCGAPADAPQIGLLNAIVVALGGTPRAWPAYTAISPWNNLFLVIIVAWLQTGFAMVLFSAALKGIPDEILEAARVDGANEIQVFFRIMIPTIRGTIITVTTTIVIFTLKIFDVVWVMTGGQFGTDVIATQFYRQSFIARNAGYGSAIAIVLLIAVIPVMIYNSAPVQRTGGLLVAGGSRQKWTGLLLVNGTLLILVLLWTIPTMGLFISSWRTRIDIQTLRMVDGLPPSRMADGRRARPQGAGAGFHSRHGGGGRDRHVRGTARRRGNAGRQACAVGGQPAHRSHRSAGPGVDDEPGISRRRTTNRCLMGKDFEYQRPDGTVEVIPGDNFWGAILNSIAVAIPPP